MAIIRKSIFKVKDKKRVCDGTTPKYFSKINGSGSEKLSRMKTNYSIDLFLSALFIIIAISGLLMYFFMPSGIPRGGQIVYLGLTKTTWIWIHSRAGILMVSLTIIHLILHWKWIVKTTRNFFGKGKENPVCEE